MNTTKSMFTAKDLLLIGVLVVIGIALTLFIYIPIDSAESSQYVEVSVDGKVISTFSLEKDHEEKIQTTANGLNVFSIKNHEVTMTEANCKDFTCIHRGSISRVGESIVCLPHRVVLKIVATKPTTDSLDAVAE